MMTASINLALTRIMMTIRPAAPQPPIKRCGRRAQVKVVVAVMFLHIIGHVILKKKSPEPPSRESRRRGPDDIVPLF